MSFAVRLSTNSLATPSNLVRWGKRKMGSCPLCHNKNATLSHIVNFCPVSLKQGRFTWRHDSVLQHITRTVKNLSTPNTDVYADLDGWKINAGTIPADILVSSGKGSRPDLVLINRSEEKNCLARVDMLPPSQYYRCSQCEKCYIYSTENCTHREGIHGRPSTI